MIGISLFCHGNMAEGIKDSVRLIIGEQEKFSVLGLHEGDDFDAFKDRVYEKVKEVNDGEGVIVFVDLMGASPFNAAGMNTARLKEENINIRVITGANLPMLLETFMQRESAESIEELYKISLEAGRTSIKELFQDIMN